MKISTRKQKRFFQRNFILSLFVFILCLFPLIVFDKVIIKIIWVLFYIFFYIGTVYFWANFIPFISVSDFHVFKLLSGIISEGFIRRKSVYRIESGHFDKDYFSITNKPHIHTLLIDWQSMVITKGGDKGKQLLTQGFWHLAKGEEVIHVLDLSPTQFYWGPKSTQNPFHIQRNYSRNFVKANSLSLALENTKCQIKDGNLIAPVFSIFYVIKSPAIRDSSTQNLLGISNIFESKGITGELKNIINSTIGDLAANQLKQILSETDETILQNMIKSKSQLMHLIQGEFNTRIEKHVFLEAFNEPLGKDLLSCIDLKIYLTELWMK